MWDSLYSWCNKWGNVASVASLFITFVGFVVTLSKIRQQRDILEATNSATKATLDEVHKRLLAHQVAELQWLVGDFIRSCRVSEWERIHYGTDRLRAVLASLMENYQLEESSRQMLAAAADDIKSISDAIYRSKKKGGNVTVSLSSISKLEDLAMLIGRLDARVRLPRPVPSELPNGNETHQDTSTAS